MPAIQFADFNATPGTTSPTQFPVAHIIKRLPRPLEEQYWSLKPRLQKVDTGPIGSTPGALRVFILPAPNQQALAKSLHRGKLFRQQKPAEKLKSLTIVVDRPQRADLRVLQDPSVEDCEEAHLFMQGFEFENHLLRDKNALTHSPKTVGSLRLYGSHRGDVFLSESL